MPNYSKNEPASDLPVEEEEADIHEAYPLMDAVARHEGWDDPEMESYNVYARISQPRQFNEEVMGSMPNPLEWSKEMENLFWHSVGEIIRDDPRTDWSENLSLGYPFEVIREQVLAKGLADFSQGHDHAEYGCLSADEKVLLYCFVNFKKHFFTALATFEAHRTAIEELFSTEARLLVIDIGCGPATACLALADLLPGRVFDYLGIDSAAPMRSKAQTLWEACRLNGLIGAGSTADFKESWTELSVVQTASANPILVILSYCCASNTLTLPALQSMAHTIRQLIERRGNSPLVLAYMNSTNPLANIRYEVVKQNLGLDPEQHPLAQRVIEYRKKRGAAGVSREEFVHELLHFKRS